MNHRLFRANRAMWTIVLALLLMPAHLLAQLSTPNGADDSATAGAVGAKAADAATDSIISPDDVLDIYLVDVPELTRQYRVSPSGTIALPLLEAPLQAAGLTLTAFSNAVAEQLRTAGLVTNPHVTVSIASSRVKSVAISGAVKHPQIYPVFGRTTILDVISQAEGLTDDASTVAIITRGDYGPQTAANERTVSVDLRALLDNGEASANVDVYPGDRVTVPRAGIVYVVGAVNRPGGFTLKSNGIGMTVLQAIALAEDLKSTAIRKKAVLIRLDPSAPGGRRQVPVDVGKVLAGTAEDLKLQANDILFIPGSNSSKILQRGVEAAVQTATGVVIYRR